MASVEKCESCNALTGRRGKSPRPSSSRLVVGFVGAEIAPYQQEKSSHAVWLLCKTPMMLHFDVSVMCSIQLRNSECVFGGNAVSFRI